MKRVSTDRIAIALVVIFYFLFSLFNYCLIEEDAFIFFRFAENIVNGNGHVFNQQDGRIEACSSLPWLYLLVFFRAGGFDLPTTSKLLGILFGGISLLILYRLTSAFNEAFPWVIFPSLLTALNVPFLMWNQMGMETALYTTLSLFFILVLIDRSLFLWWTLAAILLVVTRPEGIFIVLGMLPPLMLMNVEKKKILIFCALFLGLGLMLIMVRFFYFHDFLPSSFYHKVSPSQYKQGLYYVHMFCRDYFFYCLFLPLAWVLGKRWNWDEKRTIIFWFIIIHVAWVVLAGREFNKPFFRPLVPIIPIIYLYTVTAVGNVLAQSRTAWRYCAYSSMVLFALASLLLSRSYWQLHVPIANPVRKNVRHLYQNPSLSAVYRDRIAQPLRSRQVLVGEFISRNYAKETTLAYDQMGAVPYRAGIEYCFIDTSGLTDKTMGYYYFHQRCKGSHLLSLYENVLRWCIRAISPEATFCDTTDAAIDYLLKRDPDLVLVWELLLRIKHNLTTALVSDRHFQKSYRLAYYMNGTFFFEKKRLARKPLDIPGGLSLVPAEEMPRILEKDHPLLTALGE